MRHIPALAFSAGHCRSSGHRTSQEGRPFFGDAAVPGEPATAADAGGKSSPIAQGLGGVETLEIPDLSNYRGGIDLTYPGDRFEEFDRLFVLRGDFQVSYQCFYCPSKWSIVARWSSITRRAARRSCSPTSRPCNHSRPLLPNRSVTGDLRLYAPSTA